VLGKSPMNKFLIDPLSHTAWLQSLINWSRAPCHLDSVLCQHSAGSHIFVFIWANSQQKSKIFYSMNQRPRWDWKKNRSRKSRDTPFKKAVVPALKWNDRSIESMKLSLRIIQHFRSFTRPSDRDRNYRLFPDRGKEKNYIYSIWFTLIKCMLTSRITFPLFSKYFSFISTVWTWIQSTYN
jgi:hypothetical protein